MRSIAFLLDDSSVHDADLTDPEQGNPAIGGTEFSFVSLAHELAARGLARTTLIHHNRTNVYPKTVHVLTVDDYPKGLRSTIAGAGPIDCVVVRGHDSLPGAGILDLIPAGLPVIAWSHNHLRSKTLAYFAGCEQVKRVIYVGREQCALAAGAACHSKATYIVPGSYALSRPYGQKDLRAVYIGSLVPQKGFHRLARLWPHIRRACPEAELDVIGSSRISHHQQELGGLGVASPSYEKRILRYLHQDPGGYGVRFHGKMGVEKYEVLSRALVGLPNPTGFTECCPASVVEMSSCGAVVVALRQWGMCDTILDRVTGYLCRNEREYVRRVVSLFENRDTARAMGIAGQRFVQDTFSYSNVCDQWVRLFEEVQSSATSNYSSPLISGRYPLLKLRRLNRRIRSHRLHAVVSFVDRVRGVFLKRY
jgi:glycosyltransferase involved in cell wall biosynthesis